MPIIHLEKIGLSGIVTEKMIEDEIVKNPSILGLGDLVLIERQRTQPTNGRLDLLLQDPDSKRRYEIEIQLGNTDESHIIRTIEYWDTERKRYQQYDHCAVIIAENITARFFNVINLFNGFVPLIAIKMEARKVGDDIDLSFTKVLEENVPGTNEEERNIEITDRNYWITKKGSKETVEVVDSLLEIINEFSPGYKLNYTKFYIGLMKDDQINNFIQFIPRRNRVSEVDIKLPFSEEIQKSIEEKNLIYLDYDSVYSKVYRLKLPKNDIEKNKEFIKQLFVKAYENSR